MRRDERGMCVLIIDIGGYDRQERFWFEYCNLEEKENDYVRSGNRAVD